MWGGGYYNRLIFQPAESRCIFLSWFTVCCQHRHCQISKWRHWEHCTGGNPCHCLWFGTAVQQNHTAELLHALLLCTALKNFHVCVKKMVCIIAASFDCYVPEHQAAPISTPHDVLKPFTRINQMLCFLVLCISHQCCYYRHEIFPCYIAAFYSKFMLV